MLNSIRIKSKLFIMVAASVTGFLAITLFSLATIRTVKVGGPLYDTVVLGKDLVADVLPPPEYIIETYLVANRIEKKMTDPAARAEVEQLTLRVESLRQEYDTRHEVWVKSLEPGPLREAMVVRSYDAARAFFEAYDREFLPAVLAGRAGEATRVLEGRLTPLYQEHRAAIDDVVRLSIEWTAAVEAETRAVLARRTMQLAGLALMLTAAIVAGSLLIARRITSPIGHAVASLQAMSEGVGDLTGRLDASRGDELGDLGRAFNRTMEQLHAMIARLRQLSDGTATAAHQLAAASDAISTGAQEQASSLEETASSLEEITATVKQNADNAQAANAAARAAQEVAVRGGQAVESTVGAMSEINQSARRIAEIITTIDEIAFQTNLLALNAAVEAARAGEQGRGFAVVAAEVRSLAQRSASAAREIKGLIHDSVEKVDGGCQLVNRSGESLREIVASVKRVTDLVGEIAAASREQASGIDQVNRAVSQMDQVVQSNASQTEELSATAQNLSGQARDIQFLTGQFRLDGDQAPAAATTGIGVFAPRDLPSFAVPRPGAIRSGRVAAARPAPALVRPRGGDGAAIPAEPHESFASGAAGSARAVRPARTDEAFEEF